jgi:hypothetical protein
MTKPTSRARLLAAIGIPLLAGVALLATTFGLASTASAVESCKRTTFDTVSIKAACAKGGQAAAKTEMKEFTRKAKEKQSDLTCKTCHTGLGPDYALKADGLARFKTLGGK